MEHNHQVWKKLRNNAKILEIVAKFEEDRKRKCSRAMVSKREESTIKSSDEKRAKRSICIPDPECLLERRNNRSELMNELEAVAESTIAESTIKLVS